MIFNDYGCGSCRKNYGTTTGMPWPDELDFQNNLERDYGTTTGMSWPDELDFETNLERDYSGLWDSIKSVGRAIDPTNKNSAIRKIGVAIDPTNKNSALRQAITTGVKVAATQAAAGVKAAAGIQNAGAAIPVSRPVRSNSWLWVAAIVGGGILIAVKAKKKQQ
jgi:hypothetical protein